MRGSFGRSVCLSVRHTRVEFLRNEMSRQNRASRSWSYASWRKIQADGQNACDVLTVNTFKFDFSSLYHFLVRFGSSKRERSSHHRNQQRELQAQRLWNSHPLSLLPRRQHRQDDAHQVTKWRSFEWKNHTHLVTRSQQLGNQMTVIRWPDVAH